jgi:hypothetical protein
MRKLRLEEESPVPNADVVTIFRVSCSPMTATRLVCESAIMLNSMIGASDRAFGSEFVLANHSRKAITGHVVPRFVLFSYNQAEPQSQCSNRGSGCLAQGRWAAL